MDPTRPTGSGRHHVPAPAAAGPGLTLPEGTVAVEAFPLPLPGEAPGAPRLLQGRVIFIFPEALLPLPGRHPVGK